MTRAMPLRPLLVSLLLAGAPAAAQTSALKGHNTAQPIDVAADRIEVRDADSQAIFSGNVAIRQGAMTLDAASVKVFYTRAGDAPEISRLDAQGGVKLTSPSETATARYGIYDVTTRQITMVGDVVLTRGTSLLKGQRLAIDLASGRSTLDGAGGGSAPGQPPAAAGSGRVTGRFVVPQRTPSK